MASLAEGSQAAGLSFDASCEHQLAVRNDLWFGSIPIRGLVSLDIPSSLHGGVVLLGHPGSVQLVDRDDRSGSLVS